MGIRKASELASALHLSSQAWGPVLWALMERTDAMVAVKEIASGRYVYVNARMQALVGRPADGLCDEDWLPPDQSAPLRIADQSATVQTVPQVSEHRVERDGSRREFSVTRLPLGAADGTSRYLCCLWLQLNPQRHTQAQLKPAP